MAKQVNPFVQISKRLASVQAKSAKINDEIKTLAGTVAVEMKKLSDAAPPAPAAKAAPKKAGKASTNAPKMGMPNRK